MELEVRELLSEQGFPGDDLPVVMGSALHALEAGGEGDAADCVSELMDAIDSYIPQPKRDIDKPFLMPVEDVFSITGRGTVATGRIERGVIHKGDTVEIVGMGEDRKTVGDGRGDVPQASGPGGRRETTRGCCCGGWGRRRSAGARYWRSRDRSRRTRSSRRRCTC